MMTDTTPSKESILQFAKRCEAMPLTELHLESIKHASLAREAQEILEKRKKSLGITTAELNYQVYLEHAQGQEDLDDDDADESARHPVLGTKRRGKVRAD